MLSSLFVCCCFLRFKGFSLALRCVQVVKVYVIYWYSVSHWILPLTYQLFSLECWTHSLAVQEQASKSSPHPGGKYLAWRLISEPRVTAPPAANIRSGKVSVLALLHPSRQKLKQRESDSRPGRGESGPHLFRCVMSFPDTFSDMSQHKRHGWETRTGVIVLGNNVACSRPAPFHQQNNLCLFQMQTGRSTGSRLKPWKSSEYCSGIHFHPNMGKQP